MREVGSRFVGESDVYICIVIGLGMVLVLGVFKRVVQGQEMGGGGGVGIERQDDNIDEDIRIIKIFDLFYSLIQFVVDIDFCCEWKNITD